MNKEDMDYFGKFLDAPAFSTDANGKLIEVSEKQFWEELRELFDSIPDKQKYDLFTSAQLIEKVTEMTAVIREETKKLTTQYYLFKDSNEHLIKILSCHMDVIEEYQARIDKKS